MLNAQELFCHVVAQEEERDENKGSSINCWLCCTSVGHRYYTSLNEHRQPLANCGLPFDTTILCCLFFSFQAAHEVKERDEEEDHQEEEEEAWYSASKAKKKLYKCLSFPHKPAARMAQRLDAKIGDPQIMRKPLKSRQLSEVYWVARNFCTSLDPIMWDTVWRILQYKSSAMYILSVSGTVKLSPLVSCTSQGDSHLNEKKGF